MPIDASIPLSGIAPKIISPKDLLALKDLQTQSRFNEGVLAFQPEEQRMKRERHAGEIGAAQTKATRERAEKMYELSGAANTAGYTAAQLAISNGMDENDPRLNDIATEARIEEIQRQQRTGVLDAYGIPPEAQNEQLNRKMTYAEIAALSAQNAEELAKLRKGEAPMPVPQQYRNEGGGSQGGTLPLSQLGTPPVDAMQMPEQAPAQEGPMIAGLNNAPPGIGFGEVETSTRDAAGPMTTVTEEVNYGAAPGQSVSMEAAQQPGQVPLSQVGDVSHETIPEGAATPAALAGLEQHMSDPLIRSAYMKYQNDMRDAWNQPTRSGQKAGFERAEKDFDIATKARRAELSASKVTQNVGEPPNRDFEFKMGDKFTSDSKAFRELAQSYEVFRSTVFDPKITSANSLAAATKFMKVLDPGSVVRESELGLALATAGILDRLQNTWNTLKQGKVLTDEQRINFFNAVTDMYEVAEQHQTTLEDTYRKKAKTWKVDPDNVLSDFKAKDRPVPIHLVPKEARTIHNEETGEWKYSTDGKTWRTIDR